MDDIKYFNRMVATEVSQRNLPHWSQKERVQFVTFRLADSLPDGLVKYFHQLHAEWMEKHPQPWTDEEAKEYHRLIVRQWDSGWTLGMDVAYSKTQMSERYCAIHWSIAMARA